LFEATEVLIATWDNMGYYDGNNEVNFANINRCCVIMFLFIRINLQRVTFQCILATNGVQSYVFFLYGDIDRSRRSIPPQIGINAGNEADFISINGSLNSNIFNIIRRSNLGCSGVFFFQVNGDIIQPQSDMQCNITNCKL